MAAPNNAQRTVNVTKQVLDELLKGTEKFTDFYSSSNYFQDAAPATELPVDLLQNLTQGDGANDNVLGQMISTERLEVRFTAHQAQPIPAVVGPPAVPARFVQPSAVMKLFIFQSERPFIASPYQAFLEFPGNTMSPPAVSVKPDINVLFERQYLLNSQTPQSLTDAGSVLNDKYNAGVHDEIFIFKNALGDVFFKGRTDPDDNFAIENGWFYAFVCVDVGDVRLNFGSRLVYFDMS